MDHRNKDDPTNQYSVNDSEWKNLANWWGNLLYHCKRDDRLLVPSRFGPQGYTINLARPLARAVAIAILSLIIAGIIRAALRR